MDNLEEQNLDGVPSMLKFSIKRKLIQEASDVLGFLMKRKQANPASFTRFATKTIMKDFKKGIRQINQKVPVYVELPKYEEKSKGTGLFTKKYSDSFKYKETGEIEAQDYPSLPNPIDI